jgi:four helix bundle protein
VYSSTKTGSFSKDYGFADQIRRAAISVSSNIAEGFERGTKTELIQFLYIAKGSCGEVRSQPAIARELGYIDETDYSKGYSLCMETSRQINGLIEYMKSSKIQGQKFYDPQDKSYAEFMNPPQAD